MLHSVFVRDFMSNYVISFRPDQDIIEATKMLADRRVGGAPVVNELGNLVGVLSDTDCIEATIKAGMDEGWRGLVSEYMSNEVATVEPNDSILDVAKRFMDDRYRRYPVVEDNRLVGQISRLDILRALEYLHSGGKTKIT